MEKFKTIFKKPLVILALIVLLGAGLRFYRLGEVSFVADEFLDINSSYAYFKTGSWQNWDFNRTAVNVENAFAPRDERAWLYKWQVAQLFRVLPPTEATARAVSALWGLVTIVLLYAVARCMAGSRRIGLIAALLFAISISALIFDRRLRMYAMFAPLYLTFSVAVWALLEKKYQGANRLLRAVWERLGFNLLYLPLAAILGAASLLVHQLTGMFVFTFFVYAAVMFLAKYKQGRSAYWKYLISMSGLLTALLAAKVFAPEFFASFAAGLTFGEDHWSYLGHVSLDYAVPLGALLLAMWGIGYLYKFERYRSAVLFWAVSFLVPLLSAIFLWSRNVGPQYIFFAQPFAVLLVAAGIHALAKTLSKKFAYIGSFSGYAVVVALAVALLPNWGYFLQQNTVYRQTSSAENPNYRKIFTYIKKKSAPTDVVVMRNFRNYYLSGQNLKVVDFGGELSREKVTSAQLVKIISENPRGFVVLSENDEQFISGEALQYIQKNLQKVSDPLVRGNVSVYQWGN